MKNHTSTLIPGPLDSHTANLFLSQNSTVLLSTMLVAILTFIALAILRCGKIQPALHFSTAVPPYTHLTYPILGSLQYFSDPWNFLRTATEKGSVSFHLFNQSCIALSSDARQAFFSDWLTDPTLGYAIMLAGTPNLSKDFTKTVGIDITLGGRSYKFLTALIRKERVIAKMPTLYAYAYNHISGFGATTDPFESFPEIIFRLTVSIVTSSNIAANQAACNALLQIFIGLEKAATPVTVLFPWFFGPDRMRRFYLMKQFYNVMLDTIAERKKEGRNEDDAMQFLIDQGLSTMEITQFAIAVLFTGNANTAVVAPTLLCDLAMHPSYLSQVRDELETFISSFNSDMSLPLQARIQSIAYDDWTKPGCLPILERCLKETIRLRVGTPLHRLNNTEKDVKMGRVIVPRGTIATFHTSFVHHDEKIFPEPFVWDPERFSPERAEDKKTPMAFAGWGLGRHPCLGQKFATFEAYLLVALMVSLYDIQVVDERGQPLTEMPPPDLQNQVVSPPPTAIHLRLAARE
ncbi:Cytochrome P450 [Mycena venus]|uniref:Cytochrome P450 n=1 Tax=Mycena venus TaxID=2733690 RepID=A0A8H6U3F4_9AGAR|nr:Cytochrome P450 [Mycena venus]